MKARVLLAAVLAVAALAVSGCTGSQGPAGPAGDAGPPGLPGQNGGNVISVPSNAQTPTDAQTAAWAALAPQVTIQSVTISSPPVVKFTVTDGTTGLPIVGLGNTSKSSTATVAGYTNLSFALAKIIPGSNGSPARWVSYIVTTVPTTTAAAAPTRPTTDNTGTLVDNGDGTYAYTFYRDVKQIQAQVAGMDAGTGNVADLDDLTFDPSLVHRVTIQLGGNAPGTGSNTPNALTNVPGVPIQRPFDATWDFTPSNGQAAVSGREIVATSKCQQCHRVLGGIPGDDADSSAASFHGGNRNNTEYCVVCHTGQRKYGQPEATFDANLTFDASFQKNGTYRLYDRAIGNFPNQIHHFHAGPNLALKGYNYAGVTFNDILFPQDIRNCTKCHDGSATSTAQTAQGDNWKNVPSRLACGGCHDGIDFATGKGVTLADAAKGLTETTTFNGLAHGGFSQADDSRCALCHTPAAIDIDTAHRPVTPPNPQNALLPGQTNANTNAAWIASGGGLNPPRVPTGAILVTYDIKSVSVNASGNPSMVFRFLQNGTPTKFNVLASTTPNPATGSKEMWDNFMGSPSAYFVYALPQDGIQAPADYNASVSGYLRAIWNGTSPGTLVDNGDGYYTVTLTSVIPSSAVMVTGGLGYSYNVTNTLPLTQTAAADGTPFTGSGGTPIYPVWAAGTTDTTVPCVVAASAKSPNCNGGLIVIAPNAQKGATDKNGNPYAARRPIVEDARCNACHQELGTFTADAFHAGQRNDGTTCSWCHTPNRTSSGWSADSTSFVHAIHASAHRQLPFTWHASSTTDSFANVEYPGVLGDCQTCHLPGTFDFSATASQDALPNRLWRAVATGVFNGDASKTITTYAFSSGSCVASQTGTDPVSVFSLSPYIASAAPNQSSPNYGIGYSFNAANATSGCTPDGDVYTIPAGATPDQGDAKAQAAYGKSLVNSPIAGVCFACHDDPAAQAHFDLNGGSIYMPRSQALNQTETCLICHGTDRIADIAVVHSPLKP